MNEINKQNQFPPLYPIGESLRRHYAFTLGRDDPSCSRHYLYSALVSTLRERLITDWRATRERHVEEGAKIINYLSLEFLMGRSLNNALLNLDIEELKLYDQIVANLDVEHLHAGKVLLDPASHVCHRLCVVKNAMHEHNGKAVGDEKKMRKKSSPHRSQFLNAYS